MATIIDRFQAAFKAFSQPNSATKSYGIPWNALGSYGAGLSGGNRDIRADEWGYAMTYLLVPDVRVCVDLYARIIGQMDSRIVQVDNDGNVETVARSDDPQPQHPFYAAESWYRREYKTRLMMHLAYQYILYDEMFVEKIANQLGGNKKLRVLNTLAMSIEEQQGRVTGYYYSNDDRPYSDNRTWLPPDIVAYDHGFNPILDLHGGSLVQTAVDNVNVLRNLNRYLRDFFRNNARPGMVLSVSDVTGVDERLVEQLKQEIRTYFKGSGNQHNGLVTSLPLNIEVFENPDLQKQHSIEPSVTRSIYRAFGVPMSMIGDNESTSYQASPELRKAFVKDQAMPHLKNIEDFVNDQLMPFLDDTGATRFEFDTEAYEVVGEEDRTHSEIIDRDARLGIVRLSEAREARGYKVDEEKDQWMSDYILVNNIPVPITALPTLWKSQFNVSQPAFPQTTETQPAVTEDVEPEEEPDPLASYRKPTRAAPENAKFNSYTYNGVTFQATAPAPSDRDDKKYMRYVRYKGDERVVHWGQPGEQMERDNPDSRANFESRHSCREKKDPFSPGFQACWHWQPNAGKAIQTDEQQELEAWRKKSLKGKGLQFEAYHLSGDAQARILAGLQEAGNDKAAIAAVFQRETEAFAPLPDVLKRWEQSAIERSDPPMLDNIPALLQSTVKGALSGVTDPDAIKAVFADAQQWSADYA